MKKIISITNKLCEKLDANGAYTKADYFDGLMIKMARDYSDSPSFKRIMDSIGTDEDLEDDRLYRAVNGDDMPGYGDDLDLGDTMDAEQMIKTLSLERSAFDIEYKMLLAKPMLSFRENQKKEQIWNRIEQIDIELQEIHDSMESKQFN